MVSDPMFITNEEAFELVQSLRDATETNEVYDALSGLIGVYGSDNGWLLLDAGAADVLTNLLWMCEDRYIQFRCGSIISKLCPDEPAEHLKERQTIFIKAGALEVLIMKIDHDSSHLLAGALISLIESNTEEIQKLSKRPSFVKKLDEMPDNFHTNTLRKMLSSDDN